MIIWKNKYGYKLHHDEKKDFSYDFVTNNRGYVAILATNFNNKVYTVSSFRYPIKSNLLEIPKGYINKNETALDAAKRELKEEIGLTAKKWSLVGTFYMVPGFLNMKCYLFKANGLHKNKSNLQKDEIDLKVSLVDKNVLKKSNEVITRLSYYI